MEDSPQRALFAISSLGLGHATRTLVVIHEYLERNWEITIVSTGNALALLRNELSFSRQVRFLEMEDYPAFERGSGLRLYYYLGVDLFATWRMILREHRWTEEMAAGFDVIFSDGRYGFYSKTTPSFIICHQIAFMPPRLLRPLFRFTSWFNLIGLGRFDSILIPDFPGHGNSLSTGLSHAPFLEKKKHRYVGLLSSYRRLEAEKDIDYLFVISGYLLEHKESFVYELMNQSVHLPGKKVFILGEQEIGRFPLAVCEREDLELLPMVNGAARQELFNRARCIIGRSGYTTIMDLVEHDKPGILIPTPNQTEQEYLAADLKRRNHFVVLPEQSRINLHKAAQELETVEPFTPPWRTSRSLQLVMAEVEPLLCKQFFSIVVPAHNEEVELQTTLLALLNQSYPNKRYEVLVVENGSTDNTFGIARKMVELGAEKGVNLRLLQSPKGVSAAKNFGLGKTARESDWVVFCDADTKLGPNFLRRLNIHLNRTDRKTVIGTCAIRPASGAGFYDRIWFKVYDYVHQFTQTSYSLQIAKADIARTVEFDSELELGEDLLFIQDCCKFGSFFFLDTDQVTTSIRRFESEGYFRLSIKWTIGALVPRRIKQNWSYDVIR